MMVESPRQIQFVIQTNTQFATEKNKIYNLDKYGMRRLATRMAAIGGWKVPEDKSPNSSLQPSCWQMQTETWVK